MMLFLFLLLCLSLKITKSQKQLEALARLRAGQRDGRCRQADDDFGGWVKTTVLFLAVNGPKFMKFWNSVGGPSQFPTPFPII